MESGMKRWAAVALLSLVTSALWAAGNVVETVAEFSNEADWSAQLPAGCTLTSKEGGQILEVAMAPGASKSAPAKHESGVYGSSASSAGKSAEREIVLRLKNPRPIPEGALRAGTWIYIEKYLDASSLHLLFTDARGKGFKYVLPIPASWQRGWVYLDTYPFDANEIGRLHPQVGAMDGGGIGLPQRPFQFKGLSLKVKDTSEGRWLLGSVESDAYALGCGQYHWAMNRPGERYWMTETLLRSGESPYLLTSFILPEGGEADFSWEVRSGFQGPLVTSGTRRIHYREGNAKAGAERLPLGELPVGQYEIILSRRPVNVEAVEPTGWRRLLWRARGNVSWIADKDGSARFLRGIKEDGEGFSGWRQKVKVSGPGTYRFRVTGRGPGAPEARLAAFNREGQNIGKNVTLRLNSSTWTTQEQEVTLPPEVDQVSVDLVANAKGEADFSSVSLKRDEVDFIQNGDFANAEVLQQRRLQLVVVSSPKTAPSPGTTVVSVPVGEVVSVAPPAWAQMEGRKEWRVTDRSGAVLGRGEIDPSKPARWKMGKAGVYDYEATRVVDGMVVDRDRRLLGGRTPISSLGETKFSAQSSVATEQDLFGPGKNYFTWSMYEYHPDEPDFLQQAARWVKDGRTAGFSLFRIRIDWNFAEPLPEVFDFEVTDQLIAEVIAQGGQVILEPRFSAPSWLVPAPQLDSYGRADLWRHGKVGELFSVWTPGMLESITRFTQAVVLRYRNNPGVAGYHLWGLPGSLDWTAVDKPYLGQRGDYSTVALAKFNEQTNHRYATPPQASQDWSRPDLSEAWREWVAFRRQGLETFFIDHVLKPLRELDDRRSVVGYFGLDFYSPRLAESARTLNWRRHTGGCELYYQIPAEAMRALGDTGRTWPQEVHLLTPVAAGLEQATFQISAPGGDGYHWNYYWRTNIRTGQWTPDRDNALVEFQKVWRPIWRELRDAELAPPSDLAIFSTWSTMQYGLRSFFPLRLGDYLTRTAAAAYREQLWPAWFSENGALDQLDRFKLIVIPPTAARVMPVRLVDALERYVVNGGRIVIFPDSGKWVIEEPDQSDGLMRRLGWKSTKSTSGNSVQALATGNSGLPLVADEPPSAAKTLSNSTIFSGTRAFVLQRSGAIPAGDYTVQATFSNNEAAIISWPHGRGEVVYVAGTPVWDESVGLLSAFYQWAGGQRRDGATPSSVELNHLSKGAVHYAIVHRLPDSYRPQTPELDREKLRQQRKLSARWTLGGLPAGRWRVTELTASLNGAESAEPRTLTSEELTKGVSVDLYLAQTRVFKLEPLP